MTPFTLLGQIVHDNWHRAEFDAGAFPEVACAALRSFDLATRLTYEEIIDWVATAPVLPTQTDLAAEFGQPPIVVDWNSRFHIEVLFWTSGTAAIHQHGFSGAFSVLSGSSVQAEYCFTVGERINEHMLLGDLRLRRCGVLTRGDIEPIHPGDGLIHSVFHLDMPSVSVVIRTHQDAEGGVQYKYFRPHLALNPFFASPETTRRVQILQLLDRLGSPRYAEVGCAILERADCLETFEVLNASRAQREKAPGVFERLIETARARHGSRIDMIAVALDELDREAVLVSRRQHITDPDHRFLLALLINLPDRVSILELVRQRYGGDPEALVMKWLVELSGADVLGIDLDPLNESILRCLVSGMSFDRICGHLSEEYSRDEVAVRRADLQEHCDRIQRLAALRTLLHTGPAA